MIDRASTGALGMVVAGLAIAALAHQPRASDRVREPKPVTERPAPAATAVRALRDGQPLDINGASAADLELLPGIGPALAQRILEARNVAGAFRTTDELLRVRGIGPRTLSRLSPLIRVEAGQGSALLVEHKNDRSR